VAVAPPQPRVSDRMIVGMARRVPHVARTLFHLDEQHARRRARRRRR